MRGTAELFAAMLLMMVTLVYLSGTLIQWINAQQKLRAQLYLTQEFQRVFGTVVDCGISPVAYLDPSVPSAKGTQGPVCYINVNPRPLNAYILIPFNCGTFNSTYVIYGTLIPSKVDDSILYSFTVKGIGPKVPCNAFEPKVAEMHISLGDVEKVLICSVSQTETTWVVGPCGG